ncbi:MAG: ABC transporter permease subunit [Bacteroidota bacterium]|nr:ABC transporter permease subunit [Bacteroidota bacterium]
MIAIAKKEISTFFGSSIGYLIIAIFLIATSLFMWIIETDFNVLQYGYANMDSFFLFSPIIFLIFIPAINMQMFSQEYKSGTIELLLTKPISEIKIIIGKYLASLFVISLMILPTICYVITIFLLGETVGNLDTGAIIGSYIGLFLLSSLFSAISIFSSSLTSNQIIAYAVGILLSFMYFYGFDLLSDINFLGSLDLWIQKLGVQYHYTSISKGILDFSTITYFITLIILFLKLTELIIINRKNV